ncbi:hypothetical protein [Paraliobacillus sp. JSM ZJ581]
MKPNKLNSGSNLINRIMLPEHVAVLKAGQEAMYDVDKPRLIRKNAIRY